MTWIQLSDGQAMSLVFPDFSRIGYWRLALALARTPRFGGHWRDEIEWYSVAQHSVIAASQFEERQLRLAALLHDAHEPFWGFGDVLRPVKQTLPESFRAWLRDREADYQQMIFDEFRCGVDPSCDEIKHIDNVVLATEKRDIMATPKREWEDMPDPLPDVITPLSIHEAAERYHTELMHIMRGSD